VRACLEQAYPLDDIIVVADSCTDETAAIARRAGATRVLETAFADKAGAQNAALDGISSDAVIGFDGDTFPEPDCIPLMMADINAGYDATCSTILPQQPCGFYVAGRRFAYALGRRWWRLCQAKVGRIQVLTGASYVFRTEAIKGIGGFPDGLISADMDATWALHKARRQLAYTAKAVSLTVEPETFRVYRAQMRRWSSGYFQNVWRYRWQALHWRSLLVIGTAFLDLACLFGYEATLIFVVATGRHWALRTFLIWLAIHAVVTIGLVASVVGIGRALKGYVPYLVLNYYNKWLYLCAFSREAILGRHYLSWTGRQGRKTVISPMTRNRKLGLSGCALLAMLAGGCAIAVRQHHPAAPARSAAVPAPPAPPVSATARRYLGVVTNAPTVAELHDFATATRARIGIDEYYARWGQPFSPATAGSLAKAGALPLISWEPTTASPGSIAAGRSDRYIRRYARAVAAYGKPVAIGFAAEMNGDWETWGPPHATPRQFTAAWRHVHRVFRREHARNVTWVWAPYAPPAGKAALLRRYYPGNAYVNWIALDNFWWTARPATFRHLFGPAITAMRKFTGKLLLIEETAGVPGAKLEAVRELFRAAETTRGMIGFVWFDAKASRNWRLEADPSALAAFRTAARRYLH
jgi:glycosyltransferase involved in cell wall biosynthesis